MKLILISKCKLSYTDFPIELQSVIILNLYYVPSCFSELYILMHIHF